MKLVNYFEKGLAMVFLKSNLITLQAPAKNYATPNVRFNQTLLDFDWHSGRRELWDYSAIK